MMYIKDGKFATNVIIIGEQQIINPTHEQYLEAGYEVYVPEEPEPYVPTNEDIKKQREWAYKERSDSYFIAYNKYLMLGDAEKAEAMKQLWLDEVRKIDEEYPYIEEE